MREDARRRGLRQPSGGRLILLVCPTPTCPSNLMRNLRVTSPLQKEAGGPGTALKCNTGEAVG